MPSQDLRHSPPVVNQLADGVGLDHPFSHCPRQLHVTMLTSRDEIDYADLIGSQTGAARLMMTKFATGEAL
ncbi:MAG: hypothetical protein ACE5EM_01145 [Sphingomonadales bacterium]